MKKLQTPFKIIIETNFWPCYVHSRHQVTPPQFSYDRSFYLTYNPTYKRPWTFYKRYHSIATPSPLLLIVSKSMIHLNGNTSVKLIGTIGYFFPVLFSKKLQFLWLLQTFRSHRFDMRPQFLITHFIYHFLQWGKAREESVEGNHLSHCVIPSWSIHKAPSLSPYPFQILC